MVGVWDLPSQTNIRMCLHPNYNEIELNVTMDLAFVPESSSCFYMVQRTSRLSLFDIRVKDMLQWTTLLDMGKPAKLKVLENPYQVLISTRGSQIKLWDVRTFPPSCVQTYDKHRSESLPLGFDLLCYGKYLATGSDNSSAYIYETCTGKLMHQVQLGNGHIQACCAESSDSLSFFVSFNNSRHLGLVDTAGLDIQHEAKSTEQIKDAYSKMAWNTALGKHTGRLVMHIQRLLGGALYAHEDWLGTLRTAGDRESKELLALIEAEYQRQLEATTPVLVKDLNAFFGRGKGLKKQGDGVDNQLRIPAKRTSQAPKVLKETTCSRVPFKK